MSGGSFDYLYIKMMDWDILSHEHELERMIGLLNKFDEPEFKAAFAALSEYQRNLEVMKKQANELLFKVGSPVCDIAKEIEWWQSGDTNEDDCKKNICKALNLTIVDAGF